MIKTLALEPMVSLVTKLLKYNDGLNKNTCINGENGTPSIMLNISILRPCKVVLGFFFFLRSLHAALNLMKNRCCS